MHEASLCEELPPCSEADKGRPAQDFEASFLKALEGLESEQAAMIWRVEGRMSSVIGLRIPWLPREKPG